MDLAILSFNSSCAGEDAADEDASAAERTAAAAAA